MYILALQVFLIIVVSYFAAVGILYKIMDWRRRDKSYCSVEVSDKKGDPHIRIMFESGNKCTAVSYAASKVIYDAMRDYLNNMPDDVFEQKMVDVMEKKNGKEL